MANNSNQSLTITIKGDTKGYSVEVDKAERSTEGLGNTADKSSSRLSGLSDKLAKVGKVAAIGFGLVAAGAVAAGVGLFSIGSEFDAAFDKIRVGTGATGAQLGALQADFKAVVSTVPADFGQASDAITMINQKLGLTGEPLQKLSAQLLNLSRITDTDVSANVKTATALFNNWGTATAQQGDTLDYLFRATQQTGIGFEELATAVSSNGVVMRQMGFSLEDTAALFGGLHKAGIEASEVMPAFSKALATSAKEGKSAQQALDSYWQQIKSAPTDTAAAGKAMELFGAKAGPKLAAMIREGKLSVADLRQSIATGSDTINAAADDTADFAEKWQLFTNKLKVLVEPIATKVFGAVAEAMDKVTPFAEKVGAWLAEKLPVAVQAFQDAAAPVFATLVDTVLPALGKAADAAFGMLQTAIGWLGDHKEILIGVAAAIAVGLVAAFVAWAISAASAAVATIAATWPIILAAVAIGLLVAALIYAYNHWEGFRRVVDNVVTWVKANVPPMWAMLLLGLRTIGEWIQTSFIPGFSRANDILGGVFDHVEEVVQVVWDLLKNAGVGIWMIFNRIADGAQIMMGIVVWAWHIIAPAAQFAWDLLRNAGVGIWIIFNSIADGAQLMMGIVVWGFQRIWEVVQFVWDLLKNAGEGIWWAFNKVADGAQIMMGIVVWAWNTIWSSVESVVGFFTGLRSRIWGALTGVWDGLVAGFRTAVNTVINLWNNLAIPSMRIGGWQVGPVTLPTINTPRIDFPDLPYFHTGGTFRAPAGSGGQGLALLRDGERIETPSTYRPVPASASSGASVVNINVTFSGVVGDPRAAGRTVVEAVKEYYRGGGQVRVPELVG